MVAPESQIKHNLQGVLSQCSFGMAGIKITGKLCDLNFTWTRGLHDFK